MSIELILHPVEFYDENDEYISFSLLKLQRRRGLLSEIKHKIPQYPCKSVRGWIGEGYETPRITDRYGHQFKYAFAEDFAILQNHQEIQNLPVNRAIWAYLKELEPTHKIVLRWH